MQVTGISKTATPPMVTQQCTDDSVDRMMKKMSSNSTTCSKQEMSKSGGSFVADFHLHRRRLHRHHPCRSDR